MTHKLQWTAGLFLLATAALCAADRRVNLIPKLQPGQTITYLIRFQSDKSVKAESKVVASMMPNDAQTDAHGLLSVEILDIQQTATRPVIHARGQFLTLDSVVWLKAPGEKKPNGDKQSMDPKGKSVKLPITSDSTSAHSNDLYPLSPAQQPA